MAAPPRLVVEAKPLETPTQSAVEQTINYCIQDGIDYFAITNGNEWEVYETHRRGPILEKRVTAFKISNMNQNTVMGMLWLWRGNFAAGEPAMSPPPPSEKDSPLSSGSDKTSPELDTRGKTGIALSELMDVARQTPPQSMSFPGGTSKPLGRWNRVQVATVEWLVETGRLSESMCPLTGPGGRVVVATSPHSRTGREFVARRQVENYWVDLHYTASNQVKRAKDILNAVGVDPATVFVS